ncbi:unnamed protein product [Heterosigma akashiwo]
MQQPAAAVKMEAPKLEVKTQTPTKSPKAAEEAKGISPTISSTKTPTRKLSMSPKKIASHLMGEDTEKEHANIYTNSPVVKATVYSHEDVELENSDKMVTLYVLDLENQDKKNWIVYRRYTEFLSLYEAIKNRTPELRDFKFPNKSTFNTMQSFTKERRVSGFDELVKILLSLAVMPQEFYDFIEPTEDDLANQKKDRVHDHHLKNRRLVPDEQEEEAAPKEGKEAFLSFSAFSLPLAGGVSLVYAFWPWPSSPTSPGRDMYGVSAAADLSWLVFGSSSSLQDTPSFVLKR